MTALDGHDSVDFQEIQLGESGFSCAVRYQGKMGILEIHWWESDPIYRPNHGSFTDICHHLSILSFRVLPTLVKVWILSHPLAASWPKSPAQKIRRHLDTDIGRQAKHPKFRTVQASNRVCFILVLQKGCSVTAKYQAKEVVPWHPPAIGLDCPWCWGGDLGHRFKAFCADADDADDADVRRTNPPTNSVKSNKSIKSQGPEKFNSERSVEASRLWTKDDNGRGVILQRSKATLIKLEQIGDLWTALCNFSQEFDSFVSTMTWWMWVFWHSWLVAVYQAEQLLGGTWASLNLSPFMAISMGNIGKHETTFRQTPKRMFGTQHGHPGQSSKIVKQHADKCLD